MILKASVIDSSRCRRILSYRHKLFRSCQMRTPLKRVNLWYFSWHSLYISHITEQVGIVGFPAIQIEGFLSFPKYFKMNAGIVASKKSLLPPFKSLSALSHLIWCSLTFPGKIASLNNLILSHLINEPFYNQLNSDNLNHAKITFPVEALTSGYYIRSILHGHFVSKINCRIYRF